MRSIAVIIGLFFSIVFSANACSCVAPPSAIEAMNQVQYVFQGKVTNHDASGGLTGGATVALVQVDRVWKGINQTQVLVYTDWSSCRFEFENDRTYLFFAFERDGKPYVIQCGKTSVLEEAGDALRELGPGKQPANDTDVALRYYWETHGRDAFKFAYVLIAGALIFGVVLWIAGSKEAQFFPLPTRAVAWRFFVIYCANLLAVCLFIAWLRLLYWLHESRVPVYLELLSWVFVVFVPLVWNGLFVFYSRLKKRYAIVLSAVSVVVIVCDPFFLPRYDDWVREFMMHWSFELLRWFR